MGFRVSDFFFLGYSVCCQASSFTFVPPLNFYSYRLLLFFLFLVSTLLLIGVEFSFLPFPFSFFSSTLPALCFSVIFFSPLALAFSLDSVKSNSFSFSDLCDYVSPLFSREKKSHLFPESSHLSVISVSGFLHTTDITLFVIVRKASNFDGSLSWKTKRTPIETEPLNHHQRGGGGST